MGDRSSLEESILKNQEQYIKLEFEADVENKAMDYHKMKYEIKTMMTEVYRLNHKYLMDLYENKKVGDWNSGWHNYKKQWCSEK